MEENIQRWGRRIRAFRKLKGMTQADLAERVHVSVFVIGKIERGKKIPAPQLLEEIALQFGVTISELKAELERERIT